MSKKVAEVIVEVLESAAKRAQMATVKVVAGRRSPTGRVVPARRVR